MSVARAAVAKKLAKVQENADELGEAYGYDTIQGLVRQLDQLENSVDEVHMANVKTVTYDELGATFLYLDWKRGEAALFSLVHQSKEWRT